MGASGAGKTTLLNILAGRVRAGDIEGDILVNGLPRATNWKRVVGYVQQDDIMYHMLTVEETIRFAASFKLPRDMTASEKNARVQQVINALGLSAVAKSKIGDAINRGVSGGERKRVSIGVELVSDPRLLFLDEPTSGLDAFTAFYIIQSLKRLAESEFRTILMTIHQPRTNILKMFDKILLLSQGKTVFFGNLEDALAHFERCGYECPRHENPADFFLDIISIDNRSADAREESRQRSDKLTRAWEAEHPVRSPSSVDSKRKEIKSVKRWVNPFWKEFGILLKRDFMTQFRDRTSLIGLIMQTVIVGLLISFIFFQMPNTFAGVQNRIGLLFFVPINQTFTIVMPLISIFALDRAIILRERYSATYRTSSAFLAKFISLIPLRLALTTLFAFMVYYISGLRTDGFDKFLVFWCLLIAHTLCAIALGIAIGASVPSVQAGQVIGPLIIVVFLLFGGNLANASSVTWILRWLQYTSLVFYCYQGLISNELSGQTFDGVPGDYYLNEYSLNQFSWYAATGALLGLMVVFLILGYIALRISTKPKMKLV